MEHKELLKKFIDRNFKSDLNIELQNDDYVYGIINDSNSSLTLLAFGNNIIFSSINDEPFHEYHYNEFLDCFCDSM